MIVAMNDGTGLKYFLTDHLGSVVAVTNSSGNMVSHASAGASALPALRQRAHGRRRDHGYRPRLYRSEEQQDAQSNSFSLGLLDYNARFYDHL
jgi:hypothetical protein